MAAVGKNLTDHKYQIPEIRSRLSQTKRSLADPISLDRGKNQSPPLQLPWLRCRSRWNISTVYILDVLKKRKRFKTGYSTQILVLIKKIHSILLFPCYNPLFTTIRLEKSVCMYWMVWIMYIMCFWDKNFLIKLTQYQNIFKPRKTPEDTDASTGFNDWIRNGLSVWILQRPWGHYHCEFDESRHNHGRCCFHFQSPKGV